MTTTTSTVQLDLFGNPVASDWGKKRTENANVKHEAIRLEYKVMYHEKRIRHDDVIEELGS